QGTQHAGDPVQTLADEGSCIEVMTGAVLPVQSDCVIPVERIAASGGTATVEKDYPASARQFVHAQGSDHHKGQRLLDSGTAISPMDVAIIASCGMSEVSVSRRPVIRVISTGNELVPAGSPIAAHQVRLSNGPALVAMLAQHGFTDCAPDHIVDDPALIHDSLARHLHEGDVLILSGGVSMGKADYVPRVLAELGVHQVFHGISQRPGKPMWFGTGPRQQLVFALPGNPVSTLVCCRQYVLPALYTASGRAAAPVRHAVLSEGFTFEPKLTCFLPVRIASRDDGVLLATPAPTNTSGDFTSLSGTAGYVELAQERNVFPAGLSVPLHLWDRP
ncbi:MAG TPA: molybdopterin molybdotransferase MoeA, partial [Woeseiaceae bacterium]|nr:molybdopterin molybdotransferase MoeA [Woeseiaceae bacterium]